MTSVLIFSFFSSNLSFVFTELYHFFELLVEPGFRMTGNGGGGGGRGGGGQVILELSSAS